MEIFNQFKKFVAKSFFWTKIVNPDDISNPIVKAIKDKEYESINPTEISEPIVGKLDDVREAVENIKFPEQKEQGTARQVELKGVSLVAIKGDKGERGERGSDGRDADEAKIAKKVLKQIPKPKDGKDGYSPIKGVDYFDGENGNDGYTPVKNVDYFDGKDGRDGSPDTATEIKNKLESLKGSERLDAKAIKNLPMGGGGGANHFCELYDTPDGYGGQQGKILRVKSDQNGIEFVSPQVIEDVNWGEINGNIENQTDLNDELNKLLALSIAL